MDNHGKYAALVDAAICCVVGWKPGEMPTSMRALALGLRDAGLDVDEVPATQPEGTIR